MRVWLWVCVLWLKWLSFYKKLLHVHILIISCSVYPVGCVILVLGITDVWCDLRENQTVVHSLNELSTTHGRAEAKSKDDTHGYVSIVTTEWHSSSLVFTHRFIQ